MNVKHFISRHFPKFFDIARERYRATLIKRHKTMSEDQIVEELGRLYKSRIGVKLNLANPSRYTEKIQWSKLYDRDPLRSILSDKYAVRAWVEERVGSKYLIPLIGVWDHPSEIVLDNLPNRFVVKTNNASGTNILVRDKSKLDFEAMEKKLSEWLKYEDAWYLFDMQYQAIPPKIIAEQYMENSGSSRELMDYKFMCFDGKPHYVWVDVDRYSDHRRAVFNMDWEVQPWVQYDYPAMTEDVPRPECLDEMIEIATKLAQGFGHVRVDLYAVDGHPYFGEMTFTNGSGFEPIFPDDYDELLGSLWHLTTNSDRTNEGQRLADDPSKTLLNE